VILEFAFLFAVTKRYIDLCEMCGFEIKLYCNLEVSHLFDYHLFLAIYSRDHMF